MPDLTLRDALASLDASAVGRICADMALVEEDDLAALADRHATDCPLLKGFLALSDVHEANGDIALMMLCQGAVGVLRALVLKLEEPA